MIADDPVIQQIREARTRFQAACGNDIEKMYLRLVEEQNKHAARVIYWEHPDEIRDLAPSQNPKP